MLNMSKMTEETGFSASRIKEILEIAYLNLEEAKEKFLATENSDIQRANNAKEAWIRFSLEEIKEAKTFEEATTAFIRTPSDSAVEAAGVVKVTEKLDDLEHGLFFLGRHGSAFLNPPTDEKSAFIAKLADHCGSKANFVELLEALPEPKEVYQKTVKDVWKKWAAEKVADIPVACSKEMLLNFLSEVPTGSEPEKILVQKLAWFYETKK